METPGTSIAVVYDEGVFKPQEPVPASVRPHQVLRLHLPDEAETASEGAEDGWTMMKRLQGCITDTPPGEPIGRDHDKYLYGR